MTYELHRDDEMLRIDATTMANARKLAVAILLIAGYRLHKKQQPEQPLMVYLDDGSAFTLIGPHAPESCADGTCRHQTCARERVVRKRAARNGTP